ncbi:MAG: Mor transcription activator family protein [Pseudomonadota bacterium]
MPGIVHAPVVLLVEVLGLPTALKFVRRFGGGRVSIPRPARLKPEGAIVQAIGIEAAKALCEEWRGLEIMVPRFAAYRRAERDRKILLRSSQGISARRLALQFKISERHVFQIRAKGRKIRLPRRTIFKSGDP